MPNCTKFAKLSFEVLLSVVKGGEKLGQTNSIQIKLLKRRKNENDLMSLTNFLNQLNTYNINHMKIQT